MDFDEARDLFKEGGVDIREVIFTTVEPQFTNQICTNICWPYTGGDIDSILVLFDRFILSCRKGKENWSCFFLKLQMTATNIRLKPKKQWLGNLF